MSDNEDKVSDDVLEAVEWYKKERAEYKKLKRVQALDRVRAQRKGEKVAPIPGTQELITPISDEEKQKYVKQSKYGMQRRSYFLAEILVNRYGDDVFEKLAMKCYEHAMNPKGFTGDIDTIRFLMDKVHPKPIHKSFVQFNLNKITDLASLEQAFILVLDQQSKGFLALEDAKYVTSQLTQLKDFILGTRIESQYSELLEKLSENTPTSPGDVI